MCAPTTLQVTNRAGARHTASRSLHAPLPCSPGSTSSCLLLPWLVREQKPENRYEIQSQDKKKQKKSNLEDEWKAQHWRGAVFPHWKKKTAEFPYPSPQYSIRSPKIKQNADLLLLYWCQPPQNKKDEGIQARPASCQQSSLRSLCTLHKNASGNTIKADSAPFYPTPISVLVHDNQNSCKLLQ